MFKLFTEGTIREEVRQMLLALKQTDADYAVTDIEREDIEEYAKQFGSIVKLHRLKSGKVKVRLAPKEPR